MADHAKLFDPLSEEEREFPQLQTKVDDWTILTPVPDDTPKILPLNHLGKPSGKWSYRNKSGELLFMICRFDGNDDRKDYRPLCYCQDAHGNKEWRWKNHPAPRPLYGLDRLFNKPDFPVLIVEGEKTADAALLLFPDYVVITSPCGSKAAGKADWGQLRGRTVMIWPDNDDAGICYANEAARLASASGAVSVAIVDVPDAFPKKWDLADALPKGWNSEQLQMLIDNAHPLAADSSRWPDPQPLRTETKAYPYPLDALPPTLRAAVEEVQNFSQAPMALVAASALSALSAAGQAHVDVRRADKLEGPCSLFMLSIADSGERKSTVDGFFTKTISDYEKAQVELVEPELVKYRSAVNMWSSEVAGLKDRVKKLSRDGKCVDAARDELLQIESKKPTRPSVPRLLYSDTTSEQLAFSLAKHWPSGAVLSSEAGLVFGGHAMGSDSLMRTLSLYNVLWDGGSFKTDRRTSESFVVKNARLTVGLQIQEETLRDFLKRNGSLTRGIGFFSRCLLSWPVSTQGSRSFKAPPKNWPALVKLNSRMKAILDMPVLTDNDGNLTPIMLEFSPAAKAEWVDFYDLIETGIAKDGDFFGVRDIASKTPDNAARVAALFHLLENGPCGRIEAVEGATRVATWHLVEALRFFPKAKPSTDIDNAEKLDKWLIEKCVQFGTPTVSIRETSRSGPSKLRNKEALGVALDHLIRRGRVRLVNSNKKKSIAVNPVLLFGGNDYA